MPNRAFLAVVCDARSRVIRFEQHRRLRLRLKARGFPGKAAIPFKVTVVKAIRQNLSSSYMGSGAWLIDDKLRDVVSMTYPYRLPKDHGRAAAGVEGLIISKKMLSTVKVLSQAPD